jgi:hypothetical protein
VLKVEARDMKVLASFQSRDLNRRVNAALIFFSQFGDQRDVRVRTPCDALADHLTRLFGLSG